MGHGNRVPAKQGFWPGRGRSSSISYLPPPDGALPSNSRLGSCPATVGLERGGTGPRCTTGLDPQADLAPHRLPRFSDERGGERRAPWGLSVIPAWQQGAFSNAPPIPPLLVIAGKVKPDKVEWGGGIFPVIIQSRFVKAQLSRANH